MWCHKLLCFSNEVYLNFNVENLGYFSAIILRPKTDILQHNTVREKQLLKPKCGGNFSVLVPDFSWTKRKFLPGKFVVDN